MSVDPLQQVHVPGWRIAFSGLNVALFLYLVLAWPGDGVAHWAVVLGLVLGVSSFACEAAGRLTERRPRPRWFEWWLRHALGLRPE